MTRPRASLLAGTADAVVLRFNGLVRDLESGRRRVAVVYVPPTASRGRVAAVLREVADELEGRA